MHDDDDELLLLLLLLLPAVDAVVEAADLFLTSDDEGTMSGALSFL